MKMAFYLGRKKGVALIITLSAVVLLTVLILAFFSRAQLNRRISFSSTNQVKADLLARSALDIVAGEVRQELAEAIATPDVSDGISPVRSGVVNADVVEGAYTIVKVAANGAPIRAGGENIASTIKISDKSLNGRSSSAATWYNNGPNLGSADVPTWVYMTRGNGPKIPTLSDAKNPASKDFVVGRFTYTVYETGGLLDANLAGSPTPTSTVPFAVPASYRGAKGSVAYADLTALDPGMTSTKVDQLVAWRSYSLSGSGSTAEKAARFDEWATGIPRANGAPDASALTAARSGYTNVSLGDNTFLNRRDLQRYAVARDFPAAAVFLTHNSSSREQPSWAPTYNGTGSAFKYADDAKKKTSINRDLQSVVAESDIQVTYYRDDGTQEGTYTVYEQEPIVQRPFSLAKLAWIGHKGPNLAAFNSNLSETQRNLAIKTTFGLEWNSTKKRWDYDHGNSKEILKLDVVCNTQKRAPDFFELLKAVILSGSIGQNPGAGVADVNAATNMPGNNWEGPIGEHYQTYSSDGDRHILQIGANIIDQADSNNYPTAIYLGKYTQALFSESEDAFNNCVFGLENLPMLQRIGLINHMVENSATIGTAAVWAQPEVWNPNESSTAGTSPTDANYPTPSVLRIATYGKCYVWNVREDPLCEEPSDTIDFGNDYASPPKQDGVICFKNPSSTSTAPAAFFNNPIAITGLELAPNATNYFDGTSASGPKNRYPAGANWLGGSSTSKFLGVYLGAVDRDTVASPQYNIRAVPDLGVSFVLEYYDGSDWFPYSALNRLRSMHANAGGSGSSTGQVGWGSYDGHVDPRTDRFSGSAGRIGAGQTSGWNRSRTVRADATANVGSNGGTGRNPIFQAWPRTSEGFFNDPVPSGQLGNNVGPAYLFDDWTMNLAAVVGDNAASKFRYRDPDGVTRPGDAWRGDINTGEGMLTYHQDVLPASAQRRRSVILNRPFRSAAELGYVFRDLPFKTIDFWSAGSGDASMVSSNADAGLLDVFCASGSEYGQTAGRINPNVAAPNVFKALLSGTAKQHSIPAADPASVKVIQIAEASAMGEAVATEIANNGPLTNAAQLATRLAKPLHNSFNNADLLITAANQKNKNWGEAPLRALSNVTSSRTWNLLIDVAAQTGRVAGSTGLDQFVVEGEKRYWLHLCIDRFSGQVIKRQLEPYYD